MVLFWYLSVNSSILIFDLFHITYRQRGSYRVKQLLAQGVCKHTIDKSCCHWRAQHNRGDRREPLHSSTKPHGTCSASAMGFRRYMPWVGRKFYIHCSRQVSGNLATNSFKHNKIRPDARIISDQCRAYNGIVRLPGAGFHHASVNNCVNFVDPHSGANTQHIEHSWKVAKEWNKRHNGTHRSTFDSYNIVRMHVASLCYYRYETRTFLTLFLLTLLYFGHRLDVISKHFCWHYGISPPAVCLFDAVFL